MSCCSLVAESRLAHRREDLFHEDDDDEEEDETARLRSVDDSLLALDLEGIRIAYNFLDLYVTPLKAGPN